MDVLIVGARIDPADIPLLCRRLRALAGNGDAGDVICDVSAVVEPDASTVDALARLQLSVKSSGRRITLRNACPELQGLLALTGLDDVVPLCED